VKRRVEGGFCFCFLETEARDRDSGARVEATGPLKLGEWQPDYYIFYFSQFSEKVKRREGEEERMDCANAGITLLLCILDLAGWAPSHPIINQPGSWFTRCISRVRCDPHLQNARMR